MVSDDDDKRRFTRELTCCDCGDKVVLEVPMIKHKYFIDWLCKYCLEERKLGIENSSRFLKWLRNRKKD